MLTLIENGDVYGPEHLGEQSILLVDGKIGRIGEVDRDALDGIGLDVEVIDASGCVVCSGFIDPHEHLLGGSGEEGFATQTPEIHLSEIVTAGITTVVGTLGVDTTMKTMAGLLAKAKALREEGLTAYLWSGGYNVPHLDHGLGARGHDVHRRGDRRGRGGDRGRSEKLMRDAIALTKRGYHVDIDVQEEDLARWLAFYVDHGGDLTKLSVSSDASKKGPGALFPSPLTSLEHKGQ